MLKGDYNEKCDIWSCGVIMYILLSGAPPFPGSSNEEIMKRVEKGAPSFMGVPWRKISPDAVNFIKRMLTYDPKKRLSAEEALNDIWILKFTQKGKVSACDVLDTMKNLRDFKAHSLMHKAVLCYMVSYVMSKEEEKKLREIFDMLDTNNDGQLSQEELTSGFKMLHNGDAVAAARDVKRVMRYIDINKNGSIDYNGTNPYTDVRVEFLVANMKETDYMNQEMLKIAFDFFDEDHSGAISIDEIKRVFATNDKSVQKILREVDTDRNGQVRFQRYLCSP